MRFMIIVKATPESESETSPVSDESLLAEMAAYHDALAKAGVLIDGSGLKPSSKGWRIRFEGQKRTVVDGPFAETKELVAGYTIIQTKTREEALEWSKRFPNPVSPTADCEIEIRELYEPEDFPQGDALDRFREILPSFKP